MGSEVVQVRVVLGICEYIGQYLLRDPNANIAGVVAGLLNEGKGEYLRNPMAKAMIDQLCRPSRLRHKPAPPNQVAPESQ